MSRFTKGRNNAFFQQRNQQDLTADSSKLLINAFKAGRKSGIINLSSRDIEDLPSSLFLEEEESTVKSNHPINYSFESNDCDRFWEIIPCSKLDLSFNKLRSLPSSVRNFSELTWLSLKNNLLTSIPIELYNQLKLYTHFTRLINSI